MLINYCKQAYMYKIVPDLVEPCFCLQYSLDDDIFHVRQNDRIGWSVSRAVGVVSVDLTTNTLHYAPFDGDSPLLLNEHYSFPSSITATPSIQVQLFDEQGLRPVTDFNLKIKYIFLTGKCLYGPQLTHVKLHVPIHHCSHFQWKK